jgi:hypothetical protein
MKQHKFSVEGAKKSFNDMKEHMRERAEANEKKKEAKLMRQFETEKKRMEISMQREKHRAEIMKIRSEMEMMRAARRPAPQPMGSMMGSGSSIKMPSMGSSESSIGFGKSSIGFGMATMGQKPAAAPAQASGKRYRTVKKKVKSYRYKGKGKKRKRVTVYKTKTTRKLIRSAPAKAPESTGFSLRGMGGGSPVGGKEEPIGIRTLGGAKGKPHQESFTFGGIGGGKKAKQESFSFKPMGSGEFGFWNKKKR